VEQGSTVVDFGISLALPSTEDVDDRQAYYLELLRTAEGSFTSAWVPDHLMEGRHYRVRDAYCEPRPTVPIPILVGGRKPKFMRVAAEKADIWQWDGPIERYRVPYDLLLANCAEIGRSLSSIRLSTFGEIYFPADRGDFPEEMPLAFQDPAQDPSGAFAGERDWILGPTPAEAIAGLRPLVDLGVSQVTLYFWDRRSLRLFIDEVIPAFR
jgi:alkanesulfonate monooxygenase SsuD/methylene tetrahydromethanopterin reductase-like flavin-dependent oxidoreductase (luciferase family)